MIDPEAIWTYRAWPVRAVDGDTIEVIVDLGLDARMEIHIRVLGLETPELTDPDPATRARAMEARSFVAAWLHESTRAGKKWPLWLRTHKDRRSFTRYLAEVWDHRGRSLRDAVIEAGFVD